MFIESNSCFCFSNTEIFSNISIAYARIKDFDNAKKYYDKAIINKALSPSLDLSLFYLYIYKNQYDKAWTLFESRKRTPKFLKSKNKSIIEKTIKAERETILNKKILILREQGIGEEILFSSMYKELINLNSDLSLACFQIIMILNFQNTALSKLKVLWAMVFQSLMLLALLF